MKVGDLIRIGREYGVYTDRIGIITEQAPSLPHKRLGASNPEDIMQILFLGETKPKDFHVMFLEVLNESR